MAGRSVAASVNLRGWRLAVLGVAMAVFAVKIFVASNTFGTTDVFLWRDFAQSVRENGPIGIYGHKFLLVYNHAPLAGWLLVVLNWLTDHGFGGFSTLMRMPASLADIATALVVFELVLTTRSVRQAGVAALAVALSPILIVVSGFHGNTDPIFVMLTLLATYLIVVRGWFGLAGAAYGLALSVKIVPVVVAPVLALIVLRAGWRRTGLFAAGLAAVMVPLWLPVLLLRWHAFVHDVLLYSGVELRQWGLVQLLRWFGLGPEGEAFVAGPGRFAILALCALLPMLVAWRAPQAAVPAVGLALVLFLLLTPAFGMQYLSWAVAGAYLISNWAATAYNVFGTVFVVVVYDHWNSAYPWHWNIAPGKPFRAKEMFLQVPAWVSLCAAAVAGLLLLRRRDLAPVTGLVRAEARYPRGGELMTFGARRGSGA